MTQPPPGRTDQVQDLPPPLDSIEDFVNDLAQLRHGKTYQALSRTVGIGHGTIHAAMNNTDKLPSSKVVRHITRALDPTNADQWQRRHSRLAAEWGGSPQDDSSAPEPQDIPQLPTPSSADPSRPRRGRIAGRPVTMLMGVLLSLTLGALLATPQRVGGTQVSIASYCLQHYPRSNGAAAYDRVEDSWAGWRCVTSDSSRVSVDIEEACREQHPALLQILGGAQFARHDQGFDTWSCWGSLIHIR